MILVTKKCRIYAACGVLQTPRYVLIEKEKNTILGTELIAEKVNVKIEDSNMEYAAITSTALRTEDRVIISSDRDVEEGDVVREKQE